MPVLQPKLKINPPGDRYEQEADALSSQMNAGNTQEYPLSKRITPLVQGGGNTTLGSLSSPLESNLMASRGRGMPIPGTSRRKMEHVFGEDFSRVRLHDHPISTQINEQLGAKAFTTGNDIFFNQGEFQPHSTAGQRLLAHELTHVVQQQKSNTGNNTDLHTTSMGTPGPIQTYVKDVSRDSDEFKTSYIDNFKFAEYVKAPMSYSIDPITGSIINPSLLTLDVHYPDGRTLNFMIDPYLDIGNYRKDKHALPVIKKEDYKLELSPSGESTFKLDPEKYTIYTKAKSKEFGELIRVRYEKFQLDENGFVYPAFYDIHTLPKLIQLSTSVFFNIAQRQILLEIGEICHTAAQCWSMLSMGPSIHFSRMRPGSFSKKPRGGASGKKSATTQAPPDVASPSGAKTASGSTKAPTSGGSVTRQEQLKGIPPTILDVESQTTPERSPKMVPSGEIDLGPTPDASKLKLYKGKKPVSQMPVEKPKPKFGPPSKESSGTFRRTGMHYNELNAAEIAAGVRVDYDPVAGRPRRISYVQRPQSKSVKPATKRSFSQDTSTEGAQSKNVAYEKSGKDKGHLVPREGVKGDADVERAVDQFTSVVPMTEKLNRGKGSTWRASETSTMKYAQDYGEVMVVIEPIYADNPPRLSDGTPIPHSIRRTIIAPDGRVLESFVHVNQ